MAATNMRMFVMMIVLQLLLLLLLMMMMMTTTTTTIMAEVTYICYDTVSGDVTRAAKPTLPRKRNSGVGTR